MFGKQSYRDYQMSKLTWNQNCNHFPSHTNLPPQQVLQYVFSVKTKPNEHTEMDGRNNKKLLPQLYTNGLPPKYNILQLLRAVILHSQTTHATQNLKLRKFEKR